MSTALPETPPGWTRLQCPPGFLQTAGPFFWRPSEAGLSNLSFRVTPRLCNPAGNCHGGMLATFCDIALAVAVQESVNHETGFLPTIGISCEFLSVAREGTLVISKSEVLRVGKRIAVARCVLVDEKDRAIVASTGSFMRTPPGDNPFNLTKMLGMA